MPKPPTRARFGSYYRGDLEEAIADLELAIEARRHGWEQFLPAAIGQHAWALSDRDEIEAAEEALASGLVDSPPPGPMLALLLEARARLHLARGRADEGLEDCLQAGRIMGDALMPSPAIVPWRGRAALAAAQLGDLEQAATLGDEEVELARRFGAPRVLGMALRAAGAARGGEEGIKLLHEAVAVLETSPAKLELARALADLGATLRHARELQAAREPLKAALDMARRFGAHTIARQAGEELAASGARLRREATRGVDALTPSEHRVAAMAAEGSTNREIAQALFLAPRTVETHLTHAYQKLGISSRSELAPAMRLGA